MDTVYTGEIGIMMTYVNLKLLRSIADQLRYRGDQETSFGELRKRAAQYMRDHAEEFAPFLGHDPNDEDYTAYCDKVESVVLAEWGGQLELKALSHVLGLPIHVYDGSNIIKMGDNIDEEPLRISYHRFYYALGEHYNSVTGIPEVT